MARIKESPLPENRASRTTTRRAKEETIWNVPRGKEPEILSFFFGHVYVPSLERRSVRRVSGKMSFFPNFFFLVPLFHALGKLSIYFWALTQSPCEPREMRTA